ncbi:MAG TPA: DoxX family membrane protein, partial [Caldilineaceae bacterium]|nr:DoxX family membrane protein [Caldilineaceae bacterium]
MAALVTRNKMVVQDPPLARFLFSDTRASWIWLVVRLWLGYKWIDASLHKIGEPAWVQTGEAVKGFWTNAVAIPEAGKPPITFDWYRTFLQTLLDMEAYRWMAPLIAYGELLIGIALILGLFTGIAAFFGAFMNWNFMMAGAASSNPVLFTLAIGLMLAWKVAGYLGLDYFLLPYLGTPWKNSEPAETIPSVG